MSVKLIKEPDNENDKEAIRVEMDGLGLIGYVANQAVQVLDYLKENTTCSSE